MPKPQKPHKPNKSQTERNSKDQRSRDQRMKGPRDQKTRGAKDRKRKGSGKWRIQAPKQRTTGPGVFKEAENTRTQIYLQQSEIVESGFW